MHHRNSIVLVLVALVALTAGGILLFAGPGGEDAPASLTWRVEDEIDLPEALEPGATEAASLPGMERQLIADQDLTSPGERVDVALRGRVVDSHQVPVPGALVHLAIARGGRGGPGRGRQIPDPVRTGADGVFEFRGQAFRNLRATFEVVHDRFAPSITDKNLGEIEAGTVRDIGDLVLSAGGSVLGSVTDIGGVGIPGAEITMQPTRGNRLSWSRNREAMLPEITANPNGTFLLPHVAPGSYRLSATARGHQNGNSRDFEVVELAQTVVDPIALGPGYTLAGVVVDPEQRPIAGAIVRALRADGRLGRGQRNFRTDTANDGTFVIEHLPPAIFRLTAGAEGYLDHRTEPIQVENAPTQVVVLPHGLILTGVVVDQVTGAPVERYAIRAKLLRPVLDEVQVQQQRSLQQDRVRLRDMATRLRELVQAGGDGAQQARQEMQEVRAKTRELEQVLGSIAGAGTGRAQRGGQRGQGGGRGPGFVGFQRYRNNGRSPWNQLPRDAGPMTEHPGGAFEITGLKEGVFALDVVSPDHQRLRTDEFELRRNLPVAPLTVQLPRGFSIAGVVLDHEGQPLVAAKVELRMILESGDSQEGERGRGNRGGRNSRGRGRFGPRDWPVLDVRTNRVGRFNLENAPVGEYRLQVEADAFSRLRGEVFTLESDVQGLELHLQPLAGLVGTVRGIPSGRHDEVEVTALQLGGAIGGMFRGGRGFNTVAVEPDGTYRMTDLEPGDYLVRAYLGSSRTALMREALGAFLGEAPPPDVTVPAGKVIELDRNLTIPDIGHVEGFVTNNGIPAAGWRVSSRSLAGNSPLGGGRGGGWGGFGGRGGATVAGNGSFRIADLSPGRYRLSVQASGRRGTTLFTIEVVVATGATTPVNMDVLTGKVAGELRTADDTDPETLRGQALLLLDQVVVPVDLQAWRRENRELTVQMRIRKGKFTSQLVRAGNHLLVVEVQGRPRVTTSLYVGGAAPNLALVRVPAPVAPKDKTGAGK